MSLADTFKKLLGGASPKPKSRPAPSKMALPASRRAEMIDWAMQVYRGKAPMGRGMLDNALAGFRAKPPRLNDPDAMSRMLRINRAETDIRRLMNHREWRYLILAGLRQLLIDAPPEGEADKPKRRTVVRR